MNKMISMNRIIVNNDYESAVMINKENYLAGNVKYGAEYIYKNQKEDAQNIVNLFYKSEISAVSVLKRTKLGMDGLMIETSKLFATHHDDNFALHRDNIFIITGMSNILWENDMMEKIPNCFKKNVYHHGRASVWSSGRSQSRDGPSPDATKTRERPSGDRANCSGASVAGVVISTRISGGSVSRR